MASNSQGNGKLQRSVKMDYSVAYRENDRLDMGLDERIIHLTRSAQRLLSDKDDELEVARADADKILKLKEAVNNRQDGADTLGILCQSMAQGRRLSSLTSPSNKRKASLAHSNTSSGSRRGSVLSTFRESPEDPEEQDEENAVEYSTPRTTTTPSVELSNVKKMTVTERRLAMEREQFSAKNLFNVRRKNSAAIYFTDPRKADTGSPDRQGSASPSLTSSKTQIHPQGQGRPMTSPAAFNRGSRSAKKQRGYLRPTTASAFRLVSFADESALGDEESFYRAARRPRSRRELQKLSELKIDPFGEEADEVDCSWTSSGDRQKDMLHSLHAGHSRLQSRVADFLQGMEDFNRRGRKTGLEQILEAT